MTTPEVQRGAAAAAAPITTARLKRFMAIRRRSHTNSNLQFFLDLEECGIGRTGLGQARHFTLATIRGNLWDLVTPEGNVRLIEHPSGRLFLSSDQDQETRALLEAMARATFDQDKEDGQ